MEKLPEDGKFFRQPLAREKRKEFLNAYLEYRKYFPKKPHRVLTLAEKLRSDEFHIFRISRWFELAVISEEENYLKNKTKVLKPVEFIPRYRKALEIIKKEFKNRKMVWCHGHFKPHEVYKIKTSSLSPRCSLSAEDCSGSRVCSSQSSAERLRRGGNSGEVIKISDSKYYLIDFAHTKMYPEGYELGFIIWANWLMGADWKLDYQKWREGIIEWIDEMKLINKKLKLKKFDSLIKASLTERCLGTILADVTASERPFKEKIKRIKLLYKLMDDLINKRI